METLIVILLAIVVMALVMVGLSTQILFKKGGLFLRPPFLFSAIE